MKWTARLKAYIKRETWWRKDFCRVYITECQARFGRCLLCHAGTSSKCIARCGYGNECPCKYNQRLILKGEHWT